TFLARAVRRFSHAMELEPRKLKNDAKKKLNEYTRVFRISSKPDREEFEMSAKVTGAGILIIGLMGFIFYLLANLLPQYL
ncbi:MAG: protein translocase SEC61 complex subunit gamma, partial [Candidatus Nanohaloarchaea archaeon]